MSNADAVPRDLLKLTVPEGVPTETGFFEISGTDSSEAVNSRVYKWFLDREKNPLLAPLFLDALQRVALEKLGGDSAKKSLTLQEYECSLEVTTASGKRIDILLDDTEAQSAIIIENKLHSGLHNDLLDYWSHLSYPEDQKIGVLLTLHPTGVPDVVESRFVNLTHLEWIGAVESEGIPVGLPLYTYGLLTDFFNSIRKRSNDIGISEQARFFFDNRSQVVRAVACRDQAKAYIESELQGAAAELELSYVPRNKWHFCYLKNSNERGDAFYTIAYEKMLRLEDPTIEVILELQSNAMQYASLLNKALEVNPESNALKSSVHTHGGSYIHFRYKPFLVGPDRIASLKGIMVRIIRDEFEPVMTIIRKRLDELYENE